MGVDLYSSWSVEAEEELDASRVAETTEKYNLIARKEELNYKPSFETLRKKELSMKQLLVRDKPVYVIGAYEIETGVDCTRRPLLKGTGPGSRGAM